MAIFIIFYGFLQIPFIKAGFGEPDAWRNGLVALIIARDRVYGPVRFPGNPVIDLSFGFLAIWVPLETLWIYTNLLTLLISLVGMYVYYKIANFHKIPQPFIPVLLLYFIPVIFRNTASSMDYVWAMTFLLIAYWFLLNIKPFFASLFFALAIGSRLTSAIFLFPFLFYMVWNLEVFPKKERIRSTVFLLISVSIPALFYLYLLISSNLFESLALHLGGPRDFFKSGYYVLQEVFGLLGTLFLIGMIVWRWGKYPPWNWESSFSIMVVFIYLLYFLYRPDKTAYIIPALPFLVLWISRWPKKIALYILAGLVILNNLLGFMIIQPTPKGLKIDVIGKGISLQKSISYQDYRLDVDFLIHYPYPKDTLVKTGWRQPGVEYFLQLPSYQKQKELLIQDRISLIINPNKKEVRQHTYWVWGDYRDKIDFINPENGQILFTPSTN